MAKPVLPTVAPIVPDPKPPRGTEPQPDLPAAPPPKTDKPAPAPFPVPAPALTAAPDDDIAQIALALSVLLQHAQLDAKDKTAIITLRESAARMRGIVARRQQAATTQPVVDEATLQRPNALTLSREDYKSRRRAMPPGARTTGGGGG